MKNEPPTYFASGSNRPADIRGFARVGQPIGVAAPEVTPNAEAEIVKLAGTGLPIFVDSGAFSEVEFTAEGVKVVAPITEEEWTKRLELYRRLAVALGSQVHVVAPDRIGDQEETLARLTRYAPELRELRALGANVLVPIQKGSKPQAEFVRAVELVLGFSDFVHAIPSKKKATTVSELAAYCQVVRPARVHLLGLGVKNTNAAASLEAIAKANPLTVVTMDSNLIAANVGRGAKPRLLSRMRDLATETIARGDSLITNVQELAIVLAFGSALDVARVVLAAQLARAA